MDTQKNKIKLRLKTRNTPTEDTDLPNKVSFDENLTESQSKVSSKCEKISSVTIESCSSDQVEIEKQKMLVPKEITSQRIQIPNQSDDGESSSFVKRLNGKKVLVIDIETTGLPERKKGFHVGKDEYYDYTSLDKYESSRIVSIASYYSENFDVSKIDDKNLQYFVIKPTDFTIDNNSTTTMINKITQEKAVQQGLDFRAVISLHLDHALRQCEYIVSHNAFFDVNILLSELHRFHCDEQLTYVKKLYDEDKILCIGEIGRNICRIPMKWQTTYKMPKMYELYEHLYKKRPELLHDAKSDVISVLEIISQLNSSD